MDRLACVELPSLALQLALIGQPQWKGEPLALLSRPTAQGEVLEVCRRARALGVRPGMTRAAALSVAPGLRTEVAGNVDLLAARKSTLETLRRFSPRVEPIAGRPGGFLVDVRGLEALHPDLGILAEKMREALRALGFYSTVVVGFSRFGAEAVARMARGCFVLESQEQEAEAAGRVPLSCLELPPRVLTSLARLGVSTVEGLLRLPAEGLLERFSQEVFHLHRRASGELPSLLQPAIEEEPLEERLVLDSPEHDCGRLSFIVRKLLVMLLARAAKRGRAVTSFSLGLVLWRDPPRTERIVPAEATLDAVTLSELARLRLEGLKLPSGAVELLLTVETERATPAQLELFARFARRDPRQVAWTLARLKAELGEHAVVRARVRSAHLPEERFEFVAFDEKDIQRLTGASAGEPEPGSRCLVRRLYTRPVPLARRPVCAPRGAHLLGIDEPPSDQRLGPYVVSGKWWDEEAHREYSFITDVSGRTSWIYFDRLRHVWYLHADIS
jgi:protein ImuB